jgi:alanyl-tRNA synthetase
MIPSSEIRQQYLDFFVQKCGHKFIASSPVVPLDDPTLLFANAGMNQFKPYFLGTEKPKFTRVVNTQKCIRAGGKHNDLDDVGKDTYHHTFFEMLGNWSFGDYFKKDAITWAWELLTQVWKIDITRLHVTVFEGDPDNGIPRDDEAAEIWKSVGVLEGHIHLGNKKDNFWEMGETGPCGPCTEIHFDRTPGKTGASLVNGGSPDVIEIWNNVFIQFNRNEDKSLTPLPAQHVDTGMGFERLCAVLNDKPSNYDTDVFTPIFTAIQQVTGARAYTAKLEDLTDTAYRVIADHIRMLTFAITDGAVPGNKGRNAVLKSVLRRAFRYGYQAFNLREPFLYKLVPILINQMGVNFPELKKNPEKVQEIVFSEEKDFLRTIGRGLSLFNKVVNSAKAFSGNAMQWRESTCERMRPYMSHIWQLHSQSGLRGVSNFLDFLPEKTNEEVEEKKNYVVAKTSLDRYLDFHAATGVRISSDGMLRWYQLPGRIPGEVIFELYTTFGFPPDLLRVMADEQNMQIDSDRYDILLKQHEDVSRGNYSAQVISAVQGELPKTDDAAKFESAIINAKVLGWVKDNAVITQGSLQPGDAVGLLLDRTNFYAEQGGQVGDVGSIDKLETEGIEFRVDNTIRLGETVLHLGVQLSGSLAIGDQVTLTQGTLRRIDVMRNHTATHLLNLALRQTLGGHVEQKGSLVDDEKTRFDFAHDKALTREEIQGIEELVNRWVNRDSAVTATVMPLEEAKKIPGVRAVFGEKYPDPVRVVLIGPETPAQATHGDSVEFCGGTHLPRTGNIGLFKILSQDAVAKGVRRVTAATGRMAQEHVNRLTGVVEDLTSKFLCKPEELTGRIEALQDDYKKLQAAMKKLQAANLSGIIDELLDKAPEIGGTKVLIGSVPSAGIDAVRVQIDRLRQKLKSAYIVLAWEEDDKVPLVVALTSDLTAKGLKAGEIVKTLASIMGGSGGGKPDLAQAAGKDASQLPAALKRASELAAEKLG